MGAHSAAHTFEAPNEKAALKIANRIMKDACYEGGHASDAGHIGTCRGIRVYRTSKPLTEAQSETLLFGKWDAKGDEVAPGIAEKWGPAILHRIRNKGSRKAKWVLGGKCAS